MQSNTYQWLVTTSTHGLGQGRAPGKCMTASHQEDISSLLSNSSKPTLNT